MSASAEFVNHVRELLAPLGRLAGGAFFGGHALLRKYYAAPDELLESRELLLAWARKPIGVAREA